SSCTNCPDYQNSISCESNPNLDLTIASIECLLPTLISIPQPSSNSFLPAPTYS
ncbi:hypothetical protein BDZ91DRAFT_717405, partial [Kalaharituber pfeilii]